MNISKFSLLLLFVISSVNSQNKVLTLEEIWNDKFKAESLESLHSMKNGKEYTVLNEDSIAGTSIDLYNYKNLEKIESLINTNDLNGISEMSAYTFSLDETKIILETEKEEIFRRSKSGIYYVYDLKDKSLQKISEYRIQEPSFSPNGDYVAFYYDNNLFIKKLTTNTISQITFDGKPNEIINGITDWVYEEEFAFVKAYEWNSNSDEIAFLRFDETLVPEFSMDVYGQGLYQEQDVFKYPKAGENNSVVSLHVYNLVTNSIKDISFPKPYEDYYIPRIKWTNAPDLLSAQVLNRHQNTLDLWLINTKKNSSYIIFTESDDAYIDVTDNLTFLKDNSFIWTSEKNGFNHIYHYSLNGELINQVTDGNWDVTDYYGYDERFKKIFYQSVEEGSTLRDVYSIGIDGNGKTRLSNERGTTSADFSADYAYFISKFSNVSTPTTFTVNNAKTGELIETIENNNVLKQKLQAYNLPNKEFSTIMVNGNELNMYMIKPPDFDPKSSYPLLMFQYSGPGSQQVSNKWHSDRDLWHFMLAQKGYVIATVDGRGTGYKGAAFKKMTQNELGKYEVQDQIKAAKQLGNLSYIDEDRIGIWGWSYGGFMSSNAIFKGNDIFRMAIAVAPVTSWRFYDTVYTERYMSTPQENPSGYDDNSPLSHVEKLKGDFLLIHGSADDNVHVQNSMRLIDALIQANKDFDWLIYPDNKHGIKEGNSRLHLYNKMTDFIDDTLGDSMEDTESINIIESNIKG